MEDENSVEKNELSAKEDENNIEKDELSAKQKAFIPINIITVILALTASLSLFFAPIITLDYAKILPAMMEGGQQAQFETVKNAWISDGSGSNTENGNEATDIEKAIIDYISKNSNLTISVTPLTFARSARSDNPIKILFGSMLKKGGMIESLLLDSFALGTTITLILGSDFTESDLARVSTDGIVKAIRQAETDEQAAKAAFTAEIRKMAQEFGVQWDAEKDAQLSDEFDEFISSAKGDSRQFTVERLVCRLMGGEECTDYDALGDKLFGELFASDPQMQNTLKSAMYVLFALAAFPALMWFILAVSAGTHILRKNKIFLTWYVKIFGLIPCLLFGVAPLVASNTINSEAAMILSSIGTTAWISGACFVLFSILSLFWLYPARRKIRSLL